jgi:HAD superfamily hydrolase (TIGR01509 family)
MRPAAVLLDMDGTLVDSEPAWEQAIHELVARFGLRWGPQDDLDIVGAAIPAVGALLVERGAGWDSPRIEQWLHERVAEIQAGHVPWRPGARQLLEGLVAAGVPTALVTMSYRSLALRVADAAPEGALRVVVAGDDVMHGKPDPEAYLTAARLLGVVATRCVAVEDSVTGISAALASGALTYGVQPATDLPAHIAGHPNLRRVGSMPALAAELGVWQESTTTGMAAPQR